MKKELLTLIAMAACAGAQAKWTEVANAVDRVVYIDRATVRKSGSTVKVWTLIEYREPRAMGDGRLARSLRSQNVYDCAEETQRRVFGSIHTGAQAGGELLTQGASDEEASPVAPGTPSAYVLRAICGKN